MRIESPSRLAAALAYAPVDGFHPRALVVGGDWAGVDPALSARVRAFPALTVAIAGEGAVLDAFDLVAADVATAERWLAAYDAHPHASSVLAAVVRAPGSLLAESLAYSALQAGPEHAAWLRDRRPYPPPEDGPRVTVRETDAAIEITLVRPERHNALDARMREALCDGLDAAAERGGLPVVLSGVGSSFCSGGDLGEFGWRSDPMTAHFIRSERSVAARLERIADRVECRVHGHCVGAGLELATFCGRVTAAVSTRFRLPEVGFGLIPGAGGTVSLPRRLGRRRFLELALTGDEIDARTALDWGLVDALVDG